ncbi:MAG: polysaccharide biosynthesis/export family protein [Verrucomicrobiales bacterium]|nr:polysaccharide biosynthesis/export family protein [Verrucomicrobiales bacterium]
MSSMQMVLRTWWAILLGVVAVGLLAGCGGVKVYTGENAAQSELPEGIDIIRVGDRVQVVFTDVVAPPPAVEQRVRENGTINLAYNETFVAAGKSISALEEEIHDAFMKYFNRITVTVRIEGRVIHVGGQVRMPGRFDYVGNMSTLDAIKVAGDFTDFARRTRVKVTRADGTEVVVDCKQALDNPRMDAPLYPGDSVYVPRKIL